MSLEQTIDNLQIRNANMVTFVGTSNTMVDTTTGRIQTKGIQHNSNVITDVSGPHGRVAPTLKKYPEIVFEEGKFDRNDTTNTYVQAGYTVSASSTYVSGTDARVAWRAFDGNADGSTNPPNIWQTHYLNTFSASTPYGIHTSNTTKGTFTADGVTYIGEWIKLKLPHKIKLNYLKWETSIDTRRPKKGAILGSNNNSDWYTVKAFDNDLVWTENNVADYARITSSSNSAYTYFMVVIEQVQGGDGSCWGNQISLYGYEEDPPAGDHSVDTTFKSRFNNPQTTGVQVLVDGATGVGTNQISGGPDPSGNSSTYVTDGKYWTLNGTLTSNLSVEANTFLEGDQPHAVSVWFNSSNLEANVSNTCVFSIASEEKLDSVNLDLQSNTWHNLTYAYQGEGGSRVTYLDGRKVAEDQAEDTFGDYPPFAMTGYSQGGYVVSQGGVNYSGLNPWELFDKSYTSSQTSWAPRTSDGTLNYTVVEGSYKRYNTTLGTATRLSGDTEYGEYVKLELPDKIRLNYIVIHPHPGSTDYATKFPAFSNVYGSNDDVKWMEITNWTPNDFTLPVNDSDEKTFIANATKSYKYLALVVTGVGGTTHNETVFNGLEYYGHRENDLVRLPDPTNVLKYPHIPFALGRGGYMDSVASVTRGEHSFSLRGYTVTSSSHYGNGGTDTRSGWSAFDEGKGGTTYNIWQSGDYYVNNTTPGTYNRNPPQRHTAGGVNYDGEWIKLELPHKINVTAIEINSAAYVDLTTHIKSRPYEGAILGSNDGSQTGTWDLLKAFSGGLTWTTTTIAEGGGRATLIPDTNTGNAYKYLVLIVNKNEGPRGQFDINQIKYYGTGVDSIPIQIGGGNIDKVANFRVYDKFVGEDQALEIWDAQKDEFGRAKPQMVLQQGKLGIGTDAPQGSLSVADEPSGFEPRWPPKPLVGYRTYIEGYGEIVVHRSPNESGGEYRGDSWWIFDDRQNTHNYTYHGERVAGTNDSYFGGTNGLYDGSNSIGGIPGDWTVLESPKPIKINDIIRMRVRSGGQATRGFIIAAANEFGGTWTKLTEQSNLVWQTGGLAESKTFHFENDTYYKYYAIIITQGPSTNGFPTLSNMEFSGIVQQGGQSVLHDGQLTLTKNLTVPRIGPALDADDTPRRDRLVVEYNTSTNPTFEGAVRDTSGRGFDGVIYSGASYDATQKAFEFNGSSDYIRTSITNHAGDYVHSVSIWFKPDKTTATIASNEETLFQIGEDFVAGQTIYGSLSGDRFYYGWHTHNVYAETTNINQMDWNHICVTYTGGGSTTSTRKIYLNGKAEGTTLTGTSGQLLSLPKDTHLTLGAKKGAHLHPFDGSISNFKLYDCALTADEAKTLYDMGRCDEGHHVVNFSKTRVGIGLGDGEAPKSTLDVRGTFQGNSPLRFYVLHGIHPSSGDQSIDPPNDPIFDASKIISITGVTKNDSNGSTIPFERHSESGGWEVDIFFDTNLNKFHLSSHGSSARGNSFSVFVVTT